jgi:hypothetical protein
LPQSLAHNPPLIKMLPLSQGIVNAAACTARLDFVAVSSRAV